MAQTGINLYEGMGGVGIHALTDTFTDNDFAEMSDLVNVLKPATVQVVGAARRDQAFSWARGIQWRYPKMRVTFRNFENETGDDGNWKKHPYAGNPQKWVDVHARFMDAGLSVLTDNESLEADFTGYVDWALGIIDRIAPMGWKADFMRLAVGNPGDGLGGSVYQYNQFNRLYKAVSAFPDGRFSLSPNEYLPWPNLDQNYVGRYQRIFQAASLESYFIPNLFIGEFGGLYRFPDGHLDSDKGWSSPELHLDAIQYLEALIVAWEILYKRNGIPVNIFCVGNSGSDDGRWKYCRIDRATGAIKYLKEQAEKGRFILPKVDTGEVDPPSPSPLPQPPPIEIPPPAPTPLPEPAKLWAVDFTVSTSRPYINFRALPNGRILKTLNPGSALQVLKYQDVQGTIWAKAVTYADDVVGWFSLQKGAIKIREI